MSSILAQIPFPQIDPVIFTIGPLSIRWYGLAYLLGFWCAYLILDRLRRRGFTITREALSSLLGWIILGVLVGGRLGWWLIYHRSGATPSAWYEPLAIWHGGMSFHGGLVGVICAMYFWSRNNRCRFLLLTDAGALAVPAGLFFGRIANFINAELVGRITDVPWGVVFPGEIVARHPSQLYEAALEGPVLMSLVWWVARQTKLGEGRISSVFLLAYGTFRFMVEFTREPDGQLGFIAFGWLTMGQILSALLTVAALILLFVIRRSSTHSQQSGSMERLTELC